MKQTASVLQKAEVPNEAAIVERFGDILGKRFARDNQVLLGQAGSAYAGLRKSAAAIRGQGANIFTQWSGDPDALGSAVLLEAILRELGANDVRILTGSLGHPQNRNLVEKCGIVLRHPNHERIARGLHCTVDTSPPLGMSNTAPVEPVRDYFFVADHHADPDEVEEACRAQGVRSVKLAYVGLPVGSTSTFLAVLAAAFGLLERVGAKSRAAAALGIYTDTSALLHATTPLDFQMFELLTRDEATEEILDDLRDYRVPPEWFEYRNAAFAHLETRGGARTSFFSTDMNELFLAVPQRSGKPAELRENLGAGASMDDVFAHFAGGGIREGGEFSDTVQTRRTARRLG